MSIEIHFFDRRTCERKVVTSDLEWHGPFWWAEGNARCDCNRSLFMYDHDPDQELSCAAINLIQIEKIVSGGEVVYQESVSELPPRLVAILVAGRKLSQLAAMGLEAREKGELERMIAQVTECSQSLNRFEDSAAFVTVCDQSIASANKIAAYEADDSVVLDVVSQWQTLQNLCSEYAEMADEAAQPFVEKGEQE